MFSCNLPPALLAEWPGFFTCYCGNTGGGTDTEIRVSTESRPWRRKFSRRSSRDSNPRPFNHESGALTTELSPPQSVLHPQAWPYIYRSLPVGTYRVSPLDFRRSSIVARRRIRIHGHANSIHQLGTPSTENCRGQEHSWRDLRIFLMARSTYISYVEIYVHFVMARFTYISYGEITYISYYEIYVHFLWRYLRTFLMARSTYISVSRGTGIPSH